MEFNFERSTKRSGVSCGRLWPHVVVLTLFLIMVQLAISSPARAHYYHDYDAHWVPRSLDVVYGGIWTRPALADWAGRSPFSGMNRNFAYYSDIITMYGDDEAEWASWNGYGGITFMPIKDSWREPSLSHHSYFTAFSYGDYFVARPCGNFSREFDNPPPPSISGAKWSDLNANGRWDSGEPAIPGWTICLYKGGELLATRSTDASGHYRFVLNADQGYTPGTYEVREESQAGWIVTSGAPRFVNVVSGSASAGHDYAGNNFGNLYPSSISGHKFEDLNQDGVRGVEEPAVANWPIQLSINGVEVASTLTDSSGDYSFGNLVPGTYFLTEDLPAPWKSTRSPGPVTVLPVHGHDYPGNDFGNYYPGVIAGAKWDDSNVDGIWQMDSEAGLGDWTIALVKDGAIVATTATATDGTYEFTGLDYGTYEVWEQLDSESLWRQSFPAADETAVPPLPTAATGHHAGLAIQSHSVYTDRDFGNVKTGSITKWVNQYWWSEPISGIEVTLTEVSVPGVLTNEPPLPRCGSTGADGGYSFDRLLPGTYLVGIDIPAGWYAELPASGTEIVVLSEGGVEGPINPIFGGAQAEPRTLGFWSHWDHKYTPTEMLALISRVTTASQSFPGLDIPALDQYLTVSGNKSTLFVMARAQYLTLWLNLASDKLGFTTMVNITSINNWDSVVTDTGGVLSLNELMLQLRTRYNSGGLSETQWEALKDICDEINNFTVFIEPATGPID